MGEGEGRHSSGAPSQEVPGFDTMLIEDFTFLDV